MTLRVQVEKHLTPPSESFIYGVKPRFVPFWHCHPEYQVTLVVQGRGRRFVGDNVSRFDSGDLVLTGPNLPHMWRSSPERADDKRPPEAITIHFSGSILGGEFGSLPEMVPVRWLLERASRGIEFPRGTCAKVAQRMSRMRRIGGLERLIELLGILRILAEASPSKSLSSRSFAAPESAADQNRIDRICRHMAENAGRDLSLAQAAAAAHMSVPTFTRFFRKCTARTFVEYLTELRVGNACRLLLETDLTATQVCFSAGFSSLPHFYRRFRKLKGMSPRAFKKQFTVL